MTRLKRIDARNTGILWPDPQRGPWWIVGHWTEIDGQPECVGLELWKTVFGKPDTDELVVFGSPTQAIGGTDLRTIPLASVLDQLWQVQRDTEAGQRAETAMLAAALDAGRVAARGRRRALKAATNYLDVPERPQGDPGPKRHRSHDEDHFRQVAAVYLRASLSPRPRPTAEVQRHFGVSYSTATKWVAHARHLRLIPPTTRRRSAKKGSTR